MLEKNTCMVTTKERNINIRCKLEIGGKIIEHVTFEYLWSEITDSGSEKANDESHTHLRLLKV